MIRFGSRKIQFFCKVQRIISLLRIYALHKHCDCDKVVDLLIVMQLLITENVRTRIRVMCPTWEGYCLF